LIHWRRRRTGGLEEEGFRVGGIRRRGLGLGGSEEEEI
jgi:hypothetical protein